MTQPNVPWYIAATVSAAIVVCGFVLVADSTQLTFLTPTVKFIVGSANAALGVFAVYLNIKKPTP